jgi:hypothetical protein
MIINIFGVDKSGKSTQAEFIKNEMHYSYFKSKRQMGSGISLEAAIKYDWYFMLSFLESLNDIPNVIFDRNFVCQYVYSLVYRPELVLKEFGSFVDYTNLILEYSRRLSMLPHLMVYCHRLDYNGITDEVADMSKASELKKYYSNYWHLCTEADIKFNAITLNFEDGVKFNNIKLRDALMAPWKAKNILC